MFLHTLRRCDIKRVEEIRVVSYLCKNCNKPESVVLTPLELFELQHGIPFSSVFTGNRLIELYYFQQGICKPCLNSKTAT